VSAPKRVVNEPAPAERTIREVTVIKRLPPGFIIPAQPVMAARPPSSGADWVHEIRHDGYLMIVRRDGPSVRLYSRNAYDWAVQLSAVATAAQRIKAKSFTIVGEAVVLGPDGLSRFEEMRSREAARTILYAFDLIEHDGADMRNRPLLDRKDALARLLRNTEAGVLLNEHITQDDPVVFAHACRLGAEGIVSKKVDGTYRSGPCRFWIKVRNRASLRLDVGRPDHLAPLLGFVRDEFAKVGRTPADKNALAGESHCGINSCAKGLVAHALASGFTVEKISY
jgi:bifunctional non-homologous end joining protein LigD